MSNLIKLIEPLSNECLYTTDNFEAAYAKALELEQMGIEVKVQSPSAPESLAKMMGAGAEDLEILKEIMREELESHDDDCDSCSIK